jgi:hypothetical protein
MELTSCRHGQVSSCVLTSCWYGASCQLMEYTIGKLKICLSCSCAGYESQANNGESSCKTQQRIHVCQRIKMVTLVFFLDNACCCWVSRFLIVEPHKDSHCRSTNLQWKSEIGLAMVSFPRGCCRISSDNSNMTLTSSSEELSLIDRSMRDPVILNKFMLPISSGILPPVSFLDRSKLDNADRNPISLESHQSIGLLRDQCSLLNSSIL